MSFKKIIFNVLAILISVNMSYGQYWGEKVLEQSFEQMDFFFAPNNLNPYGLGNFSNSTPGLIDDPLLNLIVNPANIYSDSLRKTYVYIDFRNTKNIEENDGFISPDFSRYGGYIDCYYYPSYYIQSRKMLEPVFTGAILTRPFSSLGKGLFLGLSYQAIFQDEEYYSIPQDIYRSNIGSDYSGGSMVESSDIPIIDKYSGADDMHQTGHFLSFFSGYDFNKKLQLGFKLSRTLFEREGSFGSKNLWENNYRYQNTSLWSNMENREQDYSHWDMSGGINYKLLDNIKVGLKAGYLWGDATQILLRADSSFYGHGTINSTDEWSHYDKAGRTNQNWDHDGKTYYGGINLNIDINPSQRLNVYYSYNKQNVDILLKSNVRDTSYSNYQYKWDDRFYHRESQYFLRDVRSGSGDQSAKVHKFMTTLQWQLDKRMKLDFGFNVSLKNKNINTIENVSAFRYNSSHYINYDNDTGNSYYSTNESKKLHWDFKVRQLSFQIPVFLTLKASKTVDILLGLNRKITRWKIEDVTLAVFDYREQNNNGEKIRKEKFGERYTQPKEVESDIQTTVLAGLVISPSKLFNIRLLAVPNILNNNDDVKINNFQWWIGINLFP